MRKLPRATYAIQRMTLYGKLRQSNSDEAQYGESRYVACFHHACFIWVFGDTYRKTCVSGSTPLFFSGNDETRLRRGCVE